MTCPNCGGRMLKVIYMGMPGRICADEYCSTVTGLAAFMPLVSNGEHFAYAAYRGSYWRALWRWLTDPAPMGME